MNGPHSGERFAFGAFAIAGSIAIVLGLFNFAPLDPDSAAALGFFIAIPLTLLALLLLALAVIYTLFFHRHRLLLTLSAAALLFMVEMVGEYGPVLLYNATPLIYGVITTTICATWFICAEKKR